MITIVIEKQEKSPQYDKAISLGKAYSFFGCNVKIWDRSSKPLLQMIDELRPDILYHNSGKLDTAYLAKSRIVNVHMSELDFLTVYDILSYKILKTSDIFSTQNVLIYEYDKNAFPYIYTDKSISSHMHKVVKLIGDENLRIYRPDPILHQGYCGHLPDIFFNIACSSASRVFVFSATTFSKAILCNKNTYLSTDTTDKSQIPPKFDNDIRSNSNLSLALSMLLQLFFTNDTYHLDKMNEYTETYIKKFELGEPE